MNKLSTLIAATLLAAAGAAFAQATPLTREAVVAELVAARASGELEAIQSVQGAEARTPAAAKAVATSKLPRQAVLTVRPTDLSADQATVTALATDHGENAARELGDFPAPVMRRAPVLAGR